MAPVIDGSVKVRIDGIVSTFLIRPASYRGYGVFAPIDRKYARFVRDATIVEQGAYLGLFPRLTMVVTSQERKTGLLFIDDGRFKIEGEVPIRFLDNAQTFNIVYVRFDGTNFWYDSPAPMLGLDTPRKLRELLPIYKGSTPIPSKYVEAFKIAVKERDEATMASTEGRIRTAVERAGGKYREHVERADNFSVTYEVDGEQYTSTIDKNLRVVTAGICLSGHDRTFDLQSLMSVIREGQNKELIYRF